MSETYPLRGRKKGFLTSAVVILILLLLPQVVNLGGYVLVVANHVVHIYCPLSKL